MKQAPPTQIFEQLPFNHRLRMAWNITQSMIIKTDRLLEDGELSFLLGDNGFVIDTSRALFKDLPASHVLHSQTLTHVGNSLYYPERGSILESQNYLCLLFILLLEFATLFYQLQYC